MLLYGHPESGHSYKVRLFLTLADVSHSYEKVDIFQPMAERSEGFRDASKFGEVPVLVHHGVAIAQSNAILLHLARHTGRFGPPRGSTWDEVAIWLFWEANRIGFSVPNLRYAKKFATDTAPDAVAWIAARAKADLGRLDEELTSKGFVLGEPSIVDVACAAYLLVADEAGLDLAPWPNVRAWLDRIRALPGYRPQRELMA